MWLLTGLGNGAVDQTRIYNSRTHTKLRVFQSTTSEVLCRLRKVNGELDEDEE